MDSRLVREKAVIYDVSRCLCGENAFTGQREQQQQHHNSESVTLWPKLAGKYIYIYALCWIGDCLIMHARKKLASAT